MAKILASFKNKENAMALSSALINNVRKIWVCVFQPTKVYPYYDVDVQDRSDSPCNSAQFAECEVIRDSFEMPIQEDIIMPKESADLKLATPVVATEGAIL